MTTLTTWSRPSVYSAKQESHVILPIDGWDDELPQADLEAVARHLDAKARAQNIVSDPDMGGLSPEQVSHLLYSSWGEPGAAVQFNVDLPSAMLESSLYFQQMRSLLQAVNEACGVKATVGGNLPRRFVTEMVDCMLDAEERERVWEFNKVLNEEDVHAVHISRVVAQGAGLLRRYKGKFVVPKKRVELLGPGREPKLFRDLFIAFFRRFNLAYLSGYGPEAAALQSGAPYTLYRLGSVAADWLEVEGAENVLVLPGVRQILEYELPDNTFWSISELLQSRILRPLVDWGVLEGRHTEGPYGFKDLEAVRVTALYRELLNFELDAG